MSQRAVDPASGVLHEVDWFVKQRLRSGRCEICNRTMELKADRSPNTATHFAHAQGSTCPSIKKNRRAYENLPPTEIDREAGTRLREEVKRNFHLIYSCCNTLVDGLKWSEFKELIIKASAHEIWDYRGLQLNYVPYILLTFHEMFYTKGSKMRDEAYYIVLEPGIQNLDDLWNKPTQIKQAIWKVSSDKGTIEELPISDRLDPEPGWFKQAKLALFEKF